MTSEDAAAPLTAAASVTSVTAADIVELAAGDAVVVVSGQALVFVQDPGGRRIRLATVNVGEAIVGCDPMRSGARMIATGLPGTTVRHVQVGPDTPAELLLGWISTLGRAISAGRWPQRLLAFDQELSMLAPGQHIGVGRDASQMVWAQLTAGTATLCDEPAAEITTFDPALPLPAGTWLTTGMRARVRPVSAPAHLAEWSEPLAVLGRLTISTMLARRQKRDQIAVARLETREAVSDAATQEAVDLLGSAVGGKQRLPTLSDQRRAAELATAAEVARATGLVLEDDALSRAAAEVESGREPAAAVADACNARVRPVTLAAGWWQREGPPVVARVTPLNAGPAQPTAVVWRRGWVLLDPQTGVTTSVDDDVADRVDRHAIEMLPVLPPSPSSLPDLLRLALRGSRAELVVVCGITALLAGLSFVTPFLMGQLANLFLAFAPTSAYLGLFGALLLVMFAGTTWQAVRALALLRARSQAAVIAAGAVWERVLRQPATWHAKHPLGERSAQAYAVNNASGALPDETIARLLDVTIVIGSLAAVATTNSALLFGLMAVLAAQLLVTFWMLRASARRAGERVSAAATATGRLMEILKSVNRLQVAGAESRAFLRWAQVQAHFARADQRLRRITMAQGLVIAVWPILTLAVVIAMTSITAASFGEFVTAQTAATGATMAVAAMTLSANGALVARQSLRQAAPVLESVPEGGADGAQPGVLSGGFEVQDLVFRYAPTLPAALENVSFAIAPGEHVAIVGPSGCGKTTLMRILLGLEEPESGVITVDGRDLAALNRPAVRRQIGSVLQSSTLLPCSIKDNITMGRSMSHDEVWAALELAAVADDVRAMAMGIDTPVTDGGGTLSGGQRQRVLIARALAGNPRMLILDEATSALDNLTQAAVVEALQNLAITRVVVAHRLSTIRQADRIIVMADGRVVDQGTYDELVARQGAFRELAMRQQA